jgi:hypothetical protein
MEIVFIGFVLLVAGLLIRKVVNKLFTPTEQHMDVIKEVDKQPLLPKEAEVVVKLPEHQEPVEFASETIDASPKPKRKPVTSRAPERPKKRNRKSKVDV